MMICIVPVGKTRSRSCSCTNPSYRQIWSTNGRSSRRGMKPSITPGLDAELSGATTLAVVTLGRGEKVRDVAVDLPGESGADVRAGHLPVRTLFIDRGAPGPDRGLRRG